jgi:hypothetical protein
MNPVTAQSKPAPMAAETRRVRGRGGLVLTLFIILCAVASINQAEPFLPAHGWLNAAVVVMALAASVAAFSPVLPWPNVLLAAGLAAFIGGVAHAISAVTGFPFGRGEFTPAAGPTLLGLIPWWLPMAWSVIALSARGTARLLLHRSQNHPQHGYRVILLATALAMLTSIAFHAYASHGARYRVPDGADSLFLSSGHVLHLFIQVAITPLMIDKFPGARSRNLRPLLVLAAANALFAVGIFLV